MTVGFTNEVFSDTSDVNDLRPNKFEAAKLSEDDTENTGFTLTCQLGECGMTYDVKNQK